MTSDDSAPLVRENAYLKARCAQLQDDVADLSSQVTRLQQALERYGAQRPVPPDPLAGVQR